MKKIPVYQRPFTAKASAKHSCKRPELHTTHVGTARHFSHDMRGDGRSVVTLICVQVIIIIFVQYFCGNIRIFVATTVLPLSTLCGS